MQIQREELDLGELQSAMREPVPGRLQTRCRSSVSIPMSSSMRFVTRGAYFVYELRRLATRARSRSLCDSAEKLHEI